MALYLVQHGKALPKEQDPEQHLSSEGRAEVQRMADLAENHGVRVRRIEHSPKPRAKETAEIFAAVLKPEAGVGVKEGIAPLDDVAALREKLRPEDDLMLVGHLPFMEKLVSYLITGSPEPIVIKFQNGGLVCLDQSPETRKWHIKWTLMPRIE